MPNATARQPMRTRAIALSLTFTRSTPASRSSRAASIVRSIRMERGGSISTETTNRPAASRSARPVGGGVSPVGAATGEPGAATATTGVRGSAIAGVTSVAPASPVVSSRVRVSSSSAARIAAM